MSTTKDKVIAVYGTLKKDKPNHKFIQGSTFLGEARVAGGYSLIVDGLPYLVKDKDGAGCIVELYKVNARTLKNMDDLEGHPFLYKRTPITVYDMEVGSEINVEIYLYNGDVSGDPILLY